MCSFTVIILKLIIIFFEASFSFFFFLFNNTYVKHHARSRRASPSSERQKPLEDKAPRRILRLNNSHARARTPARTLIHLHRVVAQCNSAEKAAARCQEIDGAPAIDGFFYERGARLIAPLVHAHARTHTLTHTRIFILFHLCFFPFLSLLKQN